MNIDEYSIFFLDNDDINILVFLDNVDVDFLSLQFFLVMRRSTYEYCNICIRIPIDAILVLLEIYVCVE